MSYIFIYVKYLYESKYYITLYGGETMKAMQITEYGPVKRVVTVRETAEPVLRPGHVLVDVKAAALNPIDWKMITGELSRFMQLPFPFTPASDFSGTVKAVGDGVTHLKVGDAVYGMAGYNRGGSGSLAEVTLANASSVWHKPEHLSFEEAAAVPMAGLRAWMVLHDMFQLASAHLQFR
jgi:NADPH2:quinone reductase